MKPPAHGESAMEVGTPHLRAAEKGSRPMRARKKLAFAAFTTVVFVGVLELALWLCGVRPDLYDQDPYVGFSSSVPLFSERTRASGRIDMLTAANKTAFFNVQRFEQPKPAGTYRIFCVGGSTTYGRPYGDRTSFSGWLRSFLPVADPSRRWQVINAGGISYASYRVAFLMEELAQYEPDLFVIYCGHNEFLERRTYGQLIAAPRVLTDVRAWLSRTRICAATSRLVGAAVNRGATSARTREVLTGEVDTILDHSVGPEDYHRDHFQHDQVFRHFELNLNRMIDIAWAVGAQVVLVTPAGNLRDCGPFKSEHRSGLTHADAERFGALLDAAAAARADDYPQRALAALDAAVALDNRHAEAHYQRGRALVELGRHEAAKTALQRAVEEDVCPLRAPAAVRKFVLKAASQRNVPLIDFADAVERDAEHGIPGSEQFLDHVHPNIATNRALALQIVDALHQEGVVSLSTDWNDTAVQAVVERVEARLDRRAHGAALLNVAKVFAWAGKLEEAERLASQATQWMGANAESCYIRGLAASTRGDPAASIECYRNALEINPDYVDALYNLGLLLARDGRVDEAIRQFSRVLTLRPHHTQAHNNVGAALASRGRLSLAVSHYRMALKIDPQNANAHYNLGLAMAVEGDTKQAVKHLRSALRAQPDHRKAREKLAKIERVSKSEI